MSAEATAWVMDRSRMKGGPLLMFLFIANDVDATGRGGYSTIERLAARSRMHERTVKRHLRIIEKSEELVCELRGVGQTPTQWWLPGVEKDGYYHYKRGGKMPPQRWQDATSEVATCHPGGGKMPPKSSSSNYGLSSLNRKLRNTTTTTAPPPPGTPTNHQGKAPEELKSALWREPYWVDGEACDRLWSLCVDAFPGILVSDVLNLAAWKLRTTRNLRNITGLLIATLPAACASMKVSLADKKDGT